MSTVPSQADIPLSLSSSSHLLPLSLGYICYLPEENSVAQRLLFHSSGDLMEFLVCISQI